MANDRVTGGDVRPLAVVRCEDYETLMAVKAQGQGVCQLFSARPIFATSGFGSRCFCTTSFRMQRNFDCRL